MSREIKFRAWDANHQAMHLSEHAGIDQLFNWVDRHGGAVMQYTGIKDKNGREIYEGDIVRARRHVYSRVENQDLDDPNDDNGLIEKVGAVVFRPSAGFTLSKVTTSCRWDLHDERDFVTTQRYAPLKRSYELEVIGNIYEHPELLNKEANE